MFESGQDGNVAAIRTYVCVYPFFILERGELYEIDKFMLLNER